jgi:hypothetical protein
MNPECLWWGIAPLVRLNDQERLLKSPRTFSGVFKIMNAKTALSSYQVDTEEFVSLPPIHKWHACLIRHRLKPSKQRDVILGAFAKKNHITAPALYGLLFEEGHRISLGTVYRTLNLFCKLGFAKPLHIFSQTLYEHGELSQTQHENERISCRLV